MKTLEELVKLAQSLVQEKVELPKELSEHEKFVLHYNFASGPNEFPFGLLWDAFKHWTKKKINKAKFAEFLRARYEHFTHNGRAYYLLDEAQMKITKEQMTRNVVRKMYEKRKKKQQKKAKRR